MITSKVKYIESLEELLVGEYDNKTDYVLKATYPLSSASFEKLLDIEMKKIAVLDTVFLEFDKLELTGRQILNLANNMNLNILLKEVSDQQMEEMLIAYASMDMKKTVYPAKIIVLVTLYGMYMKQFYNVDVFEQWEEMTETVFKELISYAYISDKYSMEFIVEWSKWFMVYLINERPDILKDLRQHCAYLFDLAHEYHTTGKIVPKEIKEPGKGMKSGLYIPLAFVMKDMRFHPFRVFVRRGGYDYVSTMFGGDVITALAPMVDFTIAAEQYLACQEKQPHFVERLEDLDNETILSILRDKKYVVTKDGATKKDLFPIEVKVE